MSSVDQYPSWNIPGLVIQTRELKTKKGDEVWAYSIKVMAMGGIFELQTRDAALFRMVGEGEKIVASGYFEQFNGGIKLILSSVKDTKTSA